MTYIKWKKLHFKYLAFLDVVSFFQSEHLQFVFAERDIDKDADSQTESVKPETVFGRY